MFSVFSLEEDDFDPNYDTKFKGKVLERGTHAGGKKWPYYQPPKGMFRVALKVIGKIFIEDSGVWLSSKDGWAIGYHGIRWPNPEARIGKIAKEGFTMGKNHAYQGDIDSGPNAAILGKYCGEGIYLAPKVQICMGQNFAKVCYTRPIEY